MIEVLVVIIFLGLLIGLAGPIAGKLIRRSEDMAALATIRQVMAVARLEAIKTSANVVVVVGMNSSNLIQLESFRDKAARCASGTNVGNPCTQDSQCPSSTCRLDLTISGDDGNGAQDPGEPTLGEVTLSPRIHLWKGSSKDIVADAVLFDTCTGGDASRSWASRGCIVFLPGGGISVPSPDPNPATPTDGRGIYFADWQGKNYFRVTVESNLSGKARVDKWVNEASGYYAPNSDSLKKWRWL